MPTSFMPARIGLALLLAGAVTAAAAQTRPPLEHFFENAPLHSPVLSPNGKLLALSEGKTSQRDALVVIDLTSKRAHAAARFRDADIGKVQWVNDTRLLFDTTDKQLAVGDIRHAPGLYAVNFDGSGLRQLADHRGNARVTTGQLIQRNLLPFNTFMLAQTGPRDTHFAYVISPELETTNGMRIVNLLKVDTLTGRATSVKRPGDTGEWLLDQHGEPRLAMVYNGKNGTIHHRVGATDEWKALQSFDVYEGRAGGFRPLAFGADGTLYVTATAGQDKSAVHTYDLATGKLSEAPLIRVADYDFAGRLVFSQQKLVGARLTTDTDTTIWFDPALKALQDEIDKRLTGTINIVTVPERPETPWVLVEAYSDVQPRYFLLYNAETKTFTSIGATRPQIKPAEMAHQKVVTYKARDGLTIPAQLTLPRAAPGTKFPLVVLVHGGPFLRGTSWGWRPDAQFLASRGYAVLEPEFRGSRGFGIKHFRAGWKQWGLGMQNDIADGARWAVAEGHADPARICIAGASYGGYAALMGVINDPDLYKCAINWVGVTDINLLYNGHWSFQSDMSDRWREYGMPVMVGDQKRDAAQLEATSPLMQAARVTRPVLLAYGGADRRVPLYHGEKFYKAVKETNPAVEWVVYPEEGHGWALPATRIDFWSRVEKFLDKHIGK